ncbi:MAG: OsmC family protein [Thermaceae bacterium]|nr:OsmC family protein [Thermaceae bacterium]
MQTYSVHLERTDPRHVRATVRLFTLELGASRADPEAGFNPVETLLSAAGTCLLTGLQFVAQTSQIPLEGAWVELEATRQDKPPVLTQIRYRLYLKSPAPPQRLERLVELAQRNSTVLQTLAQAVALEGPWEVAP